MSWSSRAIRARSSATAMRAAASRSRSAWAARASAASACSAALAEREAREPADREQDGDEDELAGRAPGVVVDDRRDAPTHDRQADPRLHSRRAGCRAGTAAASPATNRLATNGTSSPSTNDSAAARSQTTPARRRETAGGRAAAASTSASRGHGEPRVVSGASASRAGDASSSDARDGRRGRSAASNPYLRASADPAHALNVLQAARATASYRSRRPNRRRVGARIRPLRRRPRAAAVLASSGMSVIKPKEEPE